MRERERIVVVAILTSTDIVTTTIGVAETSKRAGRPPLGDAKRSLVIQVRVTPAFKEQVAAAAAAAEMTESDWGLEAFERALSTDEK